MFTLKVRTLTYMFVADVVIKDDESKLDIVQAKGISEKRSVRAIRASIVESYEKQNKTVVAIDNIKCEKLVTRDVYKVDASGLDVIEACKAAGLSIERIDANDAKNDDENDDESDDENDDENDDE